MARYSPPLRAADRPLACAICARAGSNTGTCAPAVTLASSAKVDSKALQPAAFRRRRSYLSAAHQWSTRHLLSTSMEFDDAKVCSCVDCRVAHACAGGLPPGCMTPDDSRCRQQRGWCTRLSAQLVLSAALLVPTTAFSPSTLSGAAWGTLSPSSRPAGARPGCHHTREACSSTKRLSVLPSRAVVASCFRGRRGSSRRYAAATGGAISTEGYGDDQSSPERVGGAENVDTGVDGGSVFKGKGGKREALDAFYRFTRPHTIRGTILASVMGVLRCLIEHPNAISLRPLPLAVLGITALFCGNVFIVGINQIYDVEIDKVNKPFLPLAANKMSRPVAWALVASSLALGVTITKLFFSKLIFSMYLAGIVAGGVYSVPPFYFKRFPVVAAATIAFVRGFSLNFGVYYAVRESLGIPFAFNPIVNFITRFMTVFAAVIAVSKDLPDTEGDKKYNVKTFATRVGVKNIAKGVSVVLLLNYLSAIVEGVVNPGRAFRQWVMVGGHAILGGLLVRRFARLKAESLDDIKDYYKFIWSLFYAEYCLYPFL